MRMNRRKFHFAHERACLKHFSRFDIYVYGLFARSYGKLRMRTVKLQSGFCFGLTFMYFSPVLVQNLIMSQIPTYKAPKKVLRHFPIYNTWGVELNRYSYCYPNMPET